MMNKALQPRPQTRHALPPVSCLLPELLGEIFILCARDYKPSSTRTVPEWVNVSYVCRRWRIIALGHPALWGYLFNASKRWTEELLARSKSTPLKIWVHLHMDGEKPLIQFFKQVADHAERIQELRLDVTSSDMNGSVSKVLAPLQRASLCAPRLEVLEIDHDGYSTLALDCGIFGGKTPLLRKLKLRRTCMPCRSMHQLTSLGLDKISPAFRLSMAELQSILMCMPNVMHIYILDALSSVKDVLNDGECLVSRKIHLPHLSRLLIKAPLSAVVALLSCANIPPCAEIKLECQSEDNNTLNEYLRLTSLLAQRFGSSEGRPPLVPITTIAVDFLNNEFVFSSSGRAFRLFPCGRPGHHSDGYLLSHNKQHYYWGCGTPLQLQLEFRTLTKRQVMNAIYHSVYARDVENIYFRRLDSSIHDWRSALSHFERARYLKLSVSRVSHFFPEICEGMEGSHLLYAPMLEELALEDVNRYDWSGDLTLDVEDFRSVLWLRKERGCAVKRLAFDNCCIRSFGREDASKLAHVDEVWWDDERLR